VGSCYRREFQFKCALSRVLLKSDWPALKRADVFDACEGMF